MADNTIQVRRGTATDLGTYGNLAEGELAFTTDEKGAFIGDGSANYEFLMKQLFAAGTFAYAISDDTPVPKTDAEVMAILSGDAAAAFSMNSQKITNLADGTAAGDAVNLGQLDAYAVGLHPLAEADNCAAATTEALPACTYDNGTAGVGATLTGDVNGALTAQDGITLIDTDRLLVKNQVAALQNGVYQVTAIGTAGTDFVLTRIGEMDEDDEIAMTFVFVAGGTTNGDTSWVCTNEPEDVDVGTDDITFGIFNSPGDITAGTGLAKTGNTLAVDGVLEDLDTLGANASIAQFLVGTGAGALAWEKDATVRASLGLTIGTNVQAYDAELLALAGLTFADQKMIAGNGAGTVTMIDLTTFAQTILDDADQGAVQDTLGVKPGTDVQIQDAELSAIAGLTSAANKIPYFTGDGTADLLDLAITVGDPGSDTTLVSEQGIREAIVAAASGADEALSNLAAVAINAALIPGTAGALDIGSTAKPWADVWIAGTSATPGTNHFKITGAATGGVKTLTLPDETGTILTNVSTIDGGSFT